MTTTGSPRPDGTETAFLSLAAVQGAHTALLRTHRETGESDGSVAAIRGFLEAGVESGKMLDSDQDRWAVQSILDYWVTTLHRATGDIPDATLADFDPELAPTLDDSLCPYLGLDSFKADQKDRYFGRQQLVDHLIERLRNSRLLALLGPSGSGKSSLVLAGLLPTLQEGAIGGSATWVYLPPIVPGADPLESLARLVLPRDTDAARLDAVARSFREDPNHLATVLGRQQQPAVVVVDQFEEIFTLCNDETDRQAFVENLLRLTRSSGPRHTVILTMRDDFMGAVSRLPSLAPQFDKIIAVVVPPTAAELRDAIERPAERIGLKFEEGLVELLLKDVVNEPAGLPLLQFTLLKLWESRDHNRITRAAYHRLGGGRECLARSADEVWEALGLQENKDTAERILLELVRPTEGREFTSKRVRRQRLYQLGIPANRITLALDRLVKARLLRVTPGETADDDRIEVAHEALVRNWPKLRTWLEEERERLRHRIALTSAAEVWVQHDRDKQLLLRGVLLDEALNYQELGDLESEYVTASRQDRDRMARRRRLVSLALITAAVIIVLGSAGGFVTVLAKNTEIRKQQSEIDSINSVRMASLTEASRRDAVTADSMRSLAQTAAARADLAEEQERVAATALGRTKVILSATAAREGSNLNLRPELSVLFALYAMSIEPTPDAINGLEKATLHWAMPIKLRRQPAGIMAISTSPNRRVAATATGNDVVLWDLPRGFEYRSLIGHTDVVRAVAFDSTGTRIASASSDGTVRIWDATTGREMRTLRGESGFLAVAFNPEGRLVAGGSINGTTTIWETTTGRVVGSVRGHVTAVWDVAFSPNGRRLLTLGQDGRALLWNTTGWTQVDQLRESSSDSAAHTKGIVNAVFSFNGTRIATASKDSLVKIWDASDGDIVDTLNQGSEVWDVSYSPDGTRLATTGSDQLVKIWDALTQTELRTLRGHVGTVYSVSFFDRSHLFTGDANGGGIIWDLSRDLENQRFRPSPSSMRAMAISRDGRQVAAGADNGRAWTWERRDVGGKQDTLGGRSLISQRNKRIQSLAYGGSGRYLAWVTEDSVTVWDLTEKRALWSRSDSTYPAAVSGQTGRLPLTVGNPNFWGVAVSPDDKYVAVAGLDSLLRIYDLTSGQLRHRRPALGEVVTVAFNPRLPRQLASGGRDGLVRIWNAETGMVEDSLPGHTSLLLDLAYNANGTRIASASADASSLIWDLERAGSEPRVVLQGHENWIWSVSFSRDGSLIATSSTDNTIRVWDPGSGVEIRSIHLPGTSAQAIEFGPRNHLVTAGIDGGMRVYALSDVSPEVLMSTARSRIRSSLTDRECLLELRRDTCPETVEASLKAAYDAALAGNQRAAFASFQEARRRDPRMTIDADEYLGSPLGTYYLTQASASAGRGDVEKTVEHLRNAKRWNPRLPLVPEEEAPRLAAAYAVADARRMAEQGKLDSAMVTIRRATTLDPQLPRQALESDIRGVAGKQAAPLYAARADSLARLFRVAEAISLMDTVLALDSTQVTANQANSLCWFGSLRRMARQVLPYCDRAVRLEPASTNIKDSRGLARALVGQVPGAIKDFTAFVNDNTNAEAARNRRREWVTALQARTPPDSIFTDAVLRSLESE
jgi:WD40 repeat protein/energy-coupling factor transporter ATP-binding protein EcfA2